MQQRESSPKDQHVLISSSRNSSKSPSPSSPNSATHLTPPVPLLPPGDLHTMVDSSVTHSAQYVDSTNLPPPPLAPHGPRSQTPSAVARTPSPSQEWTVANASSSSFEEIGTDQQEPLRPLVNEEVVVPSAKALGKRRVIEDDRMCPKSPRTFLPHDFIGTAYNNDQHSDDSVGHDSRPSLEQSGVKGWSTPVHYVYDAAAERTQEWIREGHLMTQVNGVR
jgi:hypothetical protein